jgi:(R,R)-butanediol dehydrogenase/meso-butanediol dehydrogenase/diacetyl reductase
MKIGFFCWKHPLPVSEGTESNHFAEETDMKAAVWHGRRDVRIEKVKEPLRPGQGQIQVEVAWCGICGTDLHEYAGGPLYIPLARPHPLTGVQAPVIIGHEMSGKVVEVGEAVTNFKVGDRIAACPIIGCQLCRWCRSNSMAQCDTVAFLGTSWTGGALSERLNLNAYQCFHLSESITDEVGALVEPFSATVRAIMQSGATAEDNVAIVGAGPIGLMALMAARIRGAGQVVVIEVAERRIQAALACGADAVIDPVRENLDERIKELTDGQGFDVVIECAGLPSTVLMAGKLTRTRGRLVIMGVFEQPAAMDLTDVVFREKTISGSMSGFGVYEETIQIMTDPRFRSDVLITDRIELDALIGKGYQGLLNEKDQHIKILVRPQ